MIVSNLFCKLLNNSFNYSLKKKATQLDQIELKSIESEEKLPKCMRKKYKQCESIPVECMDCSIDNNSKSADCIYGELIEANCTVKSYVQCQVILLFMIVINK